MLNHSQSLEAGLLPRVVTPVWRCEQVLFSPLARKSIHGQALELDLSLTIIGYLHLYFAHTFWTLSPKVPHSACTTIKSDQQQRPQHSNIETICKSYLCAMAIFITLVVP